MCLSQPVLMVDGTGGCRVVDAERHGLVCAGGSALPLLSPSLRNQMPDPGKARDLIQ